MMLSAVLLTITLSVLNISLREIKFSTSGKETNDAFSLLILVQNVLCIIRPDIDRFVPPTNDPNVPLNCSRDIPLSNGSNNL